MLSGGLRTKGITKKSQDKRPLISVVTVVYNGEKNLEQTILSVLNQTYDNIEYIIIDGNSTDKTLDIIKKYEDRIDYWQSEPDKGIYDAMNKGIALANGDYIGLLNADDWYESYTCEKIAEAINHEKADIYHGVIRILDENDKTIELQGSIHDKLNVCCLAHPTCFISKDIYKERKYDLAYRSAADYDLLCEMHEKRKRFVFIEEILTNFRSGGMSSNKIGMIETLKIRKKYCYIRKFVYILRIVYLKLLG